MPFKYFVSVMVFFSAFQFIASEAGADNSGKLKRQLSGKTLKNESVKLSLNRDGTMVGDTVAGDTLAGTWVVRDGNFCRTVVIPANLRGTECQSVTIKGKQATFTSPDGQSRSYTLN